MLHLLTFAISRRRSPFLIDTFKAQEKTTTLAVQLHYPDSTTPPDPYLGLTYSDKPPVV